MIILLPGLLITCALVWAIVAFNLQVRDRNRVSQSLSDVDVQLLRRHDLTPRLVEIVKGYAGYERAVVANLTEPRSQNNASPAVRTEVHRLAGRDHAPGLPRRSLRTSESRRVRHCRVV